MTPNLVPLYVASVALISILSFFARQNRKSGWVKPGRTIVPNLVGIQQSWEATAELAKDLAHAGPTTPFESASFTSQLSNLQQALGQVEPVQVGTRKPVEEHVSA